MSHLVQNFALTFINPILPVPPPPPMSPDGSID
jgi:hypothetical protein